MATTSDQSTGDIAALGGAVKLPPLEPGDHLDQKTFHARYEAMGDDVRAELIGGVVIMPSPAKPRHSGTHSNLNWWLSAYRQATPGTESHVDGTAVLGDDSEPQPDGMLLVHPQHGGQVRIQDEYFTGAPELVAEIGSSTESYDLHSKKHDYERAGVREYVVVALRQQQVFWFRRQDNHFVPLEAGSDSIFRSEVFPGLWLDPVALLKGDMARLREVLAQGLATPEHEAFVKRLAEAGPA
jgi:Uma2 family endonuclease